MRTTSPDATMHMKGQQMNRDQAPDPTIRPETTRTTRVSSSGADPPRDWGGISLPPDELTRKLAAILAGPPPAERQGYMQISLEAARLRLRRLQRGVTRRELADATGASEADLTLLEHGLLAWANLPADLRARLHAWTAETPPGDVNAPSRTSQVHER